MGLLSSIGGFLFGGQKKSGKTTTKGTSDFDPYSPTIPYLNDYLSDTDALYSGGAPAFSPEELAGYAALKGVTDTAGLAVNPAIAENNKTLSGDYLNPDTNPYIKEIADRMGQQAGAQAAATFSGRGRTGSGLAGYYSGQGTAAAVGDVYNQNYQAERGRMSSAVGMAPALEAGRYLAPQAMISAGQNISSRPFDLNQQRGGILSSIAQLGSQGKTTGETQNYTKTPGLVGTIVNSFTNKLFPGGGSATGPWG